MPVIQILPEPACAGCKWKTIHAWSLEGLQTEGVFGPMIYVHESEECVILKERDSNFPVHGARGYR